MKDQFDLEQQIMGCWGVIDDIKILSEHVMEDDDATTDSIANTLIGIENLYRLKFEKLFRTFESVVRLSTDYERTIESLRKRLEQEFADNEAAQECVNQVDTLAGFPEIRNPYDMDYSTMDMFDTKIDIERATLISSKENNEDR